MSYILDALRRSEQERSRGGTPDVNTRHELLAPAAPQRETRVLWWIAGGLAVNAVLFAGWALWPERPGTSPPVAPMQEGTAASSTSRAASPDAAPADPGETAAAPAARNIEAATEFARTPSTSEATGAPAPDVRSTPAPDPAADSGPAPAPPTPPAPVVIRDLPARIQRRIPDLDFATHIYGGDPRYSEVTINGRRYAEGDRVEGMRLSEITETGVVFDFEGYRFEVGVLDDWDY